MKVTLKKESWVKARYTTKNHGRSAAVRGRPIFDAEMDESVNRKEFDDLLYRHRRLDVRCTKKEVEIYRQNKEREELLSQTNPSWCDTACTFFMPLLMLAVAVTAVVLPFAIRRH